MKIFAVIVAVMAVLGHLHVPVGHMVIPALWLAGAAEVAACAGVSVMIWRAARWRTWGPAW